MQWVHLRGKTPSAAWRALVSGLSDIELKTGFNRAITEFGGKDDYPPTLVQFRALCAVTGDSLGLPDEETAYRQACRCAHPCFDGEWPGREVYHAARLVGLHELSTLPESKSRPMWSTAWADTVRAVIRKQPLDEPPPASQRLEHAPVMDKAAARAALNRIYQALGVNHAHPA